MRRERGIMMVTCTYCLEEKEFVLGRRDVFNSEHVVPQSLALVENSLTLIGIVCRACNDWFGKNLDQPFTRGSHEALRRFLEKQKDVTKIHELDRRKVKISLESAKDPSIRKAQVRLIHHGGELKQQFAVQLSIRLKNSDDWITVQRSEFQQFVETNPDLDLSEFKILGPELECEEFFQEMQAIWAGIKIVGNLGDEDHITDVVVDYGPTEMRAIAKIAFNYFCYITQDRPELARSNRFDAIRNYIRKGEVPQWGAVRLREKPILTNDTVNRRQTNGHIVAFNVERNVSTGKNEAVCLISIFNDLTWRVVLQPEFDGELKPRIHIWDFENRTCREEVAKKVTVRVFPVLRARTVRISR